MPRLKRVALLVNMALKHWKKHGQRVLLEHPRLRVYEDDIELPDGTSSTYIHFGSERKIGSVCLIAIRDDGKILLQKELSYPTGEFLWQWPGGATNPNEDVKIAANRELMEEAGFRAQSLEIIGKFYTDNRRSANQQYIAVARDLVEESLPGDREEAFEYKWLTPDEIDAMIRNGEITNSHCLSGWMIYKLQQ